MSEPQKEALGATLRAARERAGLTQSQVAQRAGISTSFVRMVETGRSDISLSRLLNWLALFGLAVGDVVKSHGHEGPVLVTSPSHWIKLNLGEDGVDFFLTAPHATQSIEPGMFVLAPGAGMRTPLRHEGEESLYIVSGAILLTVDGHMMPMETGATAYFRSDLEHRLENASEHVPAVVLSTTSHPSTAHTALDGVQPTVSRCVGPQTGHATSAPSRRR